ncbi:M16 family metallopeptidase [Streptomyces sp. JNUCC 64]
MNTSPPRVPSVAFRGPAPPDLDTVLAGGIRLVAARVPTVPLVEIRFSLPYSTPGELTARQVLADCLLRATAEHTEEAYDGALAEDGATLTAVGEAHRLSVSGHAFADALPRVLGLLADGLRHPVLDPADVDARRSRLAHRIRLALGQPAALAQHALLGHRYGSAAEALRPSAEKASEVTPEVLRRLHQQDIRTAGATLVLVGDLCPHRAAAEVATAFAGWPTGRAAPPPSPPAFRPGPLLPVHRPGAVQSLLRLAAPALPRTHPDFPALHLANLVLGGAVGSRLVDRLREDLGHAYRAGSGVESVPGAGTLMIEADVAAARTAVALTEIRAVLDRMTDEPPDRAEVAAAVRYAAGSTATAMASPSALATGLANLLHVGAGSDWLSRWGAVLAGVGPARVAEAAARYLRPGAFTGVVVGELPPGSAAAVLGDAWPVAATGRD